MGNPSPATKTPFSLKPLSPLGARLRGPRVSINVTAVATARHTAIRRVSMRTIRSRDINHLRSKSHSQLTHFRSVTKSETVALPDRHGCGRNCVSRGPGLEPVAFLNFAVAIAGAVAAGPVFAPRRLGAGGQRRHRLVRQTNEPPRPSSTPDAPGRGSPGSSRAAQWQCPAP
jgi:hypothetical protein